MYKRHKSLRIWTTVLTLALTVAMTVVLVSPGFAQAHGWGNLKDIGKFMEKAQKNLKKQSSLSFGDLEDAIWAIESIAKMKGFGIINGYDGNVFRPNSAVTQAEALAMIVRALDMEEEAEEIAGRFSGTYSAFGYEYDDDDDDDDFEFDFDDLEDADDIEEYLEDLAKHLEARSRKVNNQYLPYVPANTQWALGYILLAVEEGWVKISEMNPSAEASRAWVSMVMVRALGEDEAALDEMNSDLPYKDSNSIPNGMVGYVAVAVDLGLFQGYPEGQFKPNRAVTRAEMATIIDRFLNEELPDETSYSVNGTITALTGSKITVKAESGRSTTYVISSDALILVDNEPVSRSDLEVGDKVEVLSNGEGVALLITVKEQVPSTGIVTGEIVSISTPATIVVETDDDSDETIKLATSCKITYGSRTLEFSDLRIGDDVRATVQNNNVATALKVTSRGPVSQSISGIISRITRTSSETTVVIDQVYGEVSFELDEDVEITYRTSSLDPDELRTGDKVEATVRNQVITEILVKARNQSIEFGDVGGTIVSISQSASDFILTVDDGDDMVSFSVPSDCIVSYGDAELSRSGLRLGDEIRAEINNDDEALEIRILARAS